MEWLIGLLVSWLVTAVSLVILSKLPTGIEIDGFGKAFMFAAVFGILHTILWWIVLLLSLPLVVLSLGLFILIIDPIVFLLVAKLVPGFRLNWGLISAILGAVGLGIMNSTLFWVLGQFS
jgi:putative membrane protein